MNYNSDFQTDFFVGKPPFCSILLSKFNSVMIIYFAFSAAIPQIRKMPMPGFDLQKYIFVLLHLSYYQKGSGFWCWLLHCFSLVQHADFRGQVVLSISVFVEVWSGLHCHILAASYKQHWHMLLFCCIYHTMKKVQDFAVGC